MTNILIIGNGGRENAIYNKLLGYNLFKYSGNVFNEIIEICEDENINMVIPYSETYLCAGIKDYILDRINKIQVFGPTKEQAKIEGSKYFSKTIMTHLNIPTAKYKYYKSCETLIKDINKYDEHKLQSVIKYDGLAKGKGVYLPNNIEEAIQSVQELYKINKNNWKGIVVEDRLYGVEVSIMGFCNGYECQLMPQVQDYKRAYDNDLGPNTGGMGAICPVWILNDRELESVKMYMDKVVRALNYIGVLYAGIIKTEAGIYFLEFNCRMGDPETQAVINLLETDLYKIFKASIENKSINIKWKNEFSAAVVFSHNDYPYKKLTEKIEIKHTNLDKTVKIYNSNTFIFNNKIYTLGGRVLTMVSTSCSLEKSLKNIYDNAHKVQYDGVYYRKDIGCNYKTREKLNLNIAVLASGNATSIEKLLECTDTIKLFISNNPSNTIYEKAKRFKVPYFYIETTSCKSNKDYYEKLVNILRLFNIDIVLLSGYMKIVPNIIFEEFKTINIHPSLLPKYKGLMDLNIHKSVLFNNDTHTGCTLHIVDENIDEGEILSQKSIEIETNDCVRLKNIVQNLENECIYEYIINYKEDNKYNINISEGNAFVETLKTKIQNVGKFASEFKIGNKIFGASTDGCGTKLDLANKYGFLDTIGIDLVAMNVNDLLVAGYKPSIFMDYIAIDKMDKIRCNKIIKGIIKGCDIANCDLIGGETAEMKGIYFKDKLDLAGFAVGEKIHNFPDISNIKPGCLLYGLVSSGIHSNGYTLVKKLLDKSEEPFDIESLMEPTRIYTELLDIYKSYGDKILGVAHITGGGFTDNIKRIIPETRSFQLDSWKFSDIFKWIQKESNMSRNEMLSIFNCGYGIVIITSEELNICYEKIGQII